VNDALTTTHHMAEGHELVHDGGVENMMPRKELNAQLSEAQIREIEASSQKPIVEDEDCPEIDPQNDQHKQT